MRDGWTRTTLGEVTELVQRGKAPVYVESGGIVVASQKCVRNGIVDLALARRTDPAQRAVPDWAILRPGDVLVNSTGRGTLGRTGIFRGATEPVTVDSHVSIVRGLRTSVEPGYLAVLLLTKEAELEGYQTGSTTQTELSRDAIRNISIEFPPLAEQRRIVDLISALDATTEAAAEVGRASRHLRTALLADLLTGTHEIPKSYDRLLESA